MKIEDLKNKCLPKLSVGKRVLLYIVTVAAAVLCLLEVFCSFLPELVGYAVYSVTGCVFMLSCCYIAIDIRYFIRHILKPFIKGNSVTNRLTEDYRFRTIIMTRTSFGVNLFYALFNGVYGIWYHSAWFGSLAAYYIVLSTMRFLVVNYEKKVSRTNLQKEELEKEQAIYKRCGVFLALITLALGGAVITLIDSNIEKSYPGMLIYAIALYTFYKITISSINMVKVKKFKSPLLTAIRYIGYADALVSVLSLQMAMFTSFNNGEKKMIRIFNSATGIAVCLMILFLSIVMMRSGKDLKIKVKE